MRFLLILVVLGTLFGCSTDASTPVEPMDVVPDLDSGLEPDLPGAEVAPSDGLRLPPPEPVVFAVASDTHIVGDLEHGISVRLRDCIDSVRGLPDAPEALLITGDLIDSLETTPALPHGFLPVFKEILGEAQLPVHPVAGNHDYYALNYPQFLLTESQAEPDQMRREELGIEPYYEVTYKGIKFILLNSMQGELWDISLGLSGSLGAAQLAWLDQRLSDGMPAVLFLHHPPELTEELDGQPTLADVVAAHNDVVMGIFAGHLHLWSRSEIAGVPVYLTAANQDGVAYHHVRADPETMTLTVINEADIDYGEFEVSACDPEGKTAVTDWSPFAGTVHHLLVESAIAEPSGFGEYLEEAIQMLPILIRFDGPDPWGKVLSGQLTLGAYLGNGVGAIPPYVDTVPGAACLVIDLLLDNPCFISQPVNLTMDIAKAFGLPLPDGWNMRVAMTDVQFQGYAATAGEPKLMEGLLTMGLDLNLTIADVQQILVDEYCAAHIASCKPGSDGMPACPDGALGPAFYPQIPNQCDVVVAGFGLRMILALLASVPDGKGSVQALYETWSPEESAVAKVGGYAPDLFAQTPGSNCAQ